MNVTDEMRAAARDAFEAQCRLAEARVQASEAHGRWQATLAAVADALRAYTDACFRQDEAVNRVAGVPSEGPYR